MRAGALALKASKMLMMAGLPLLLALVFVSTPAARATIAGDRSPLVVETSGGAVLGECSTSSHRRGGSSSSSSSSNGSGYCSWVGIPFAEPPTPENGGRFRPPKPLAASKWLGVREGRRNKGSSNGSSSGSTGGNPGKACFQTPYDPTTPQSEDCLHLTV